MSPRQDSAKARSKVSGLRELPVQGARSALQAAMRAAPALQRARRREQAGRKETPSLTATKANA